LEITIFALLISAVISFVFKLFQGMTNFTSPRNESIISKSIPNYMRTSFFNSKFFKQTYPSSICTSTFCCSKFFK
jgi:hypothetical protein